MKKLKGKRSRKQVLKKLGLRQGYNLYFGCTASGKILPPMIGIKARKGVKVGQPLVLELKDPEITSTFHHGDRVGPKIVCYAKEDKKMLADLLEAHH